jgi:DMSO/TMAO reductase YedYZ molybdopterin-dependent catalytic subunit
VLDSLPGKKPLIKLSYRPPNYETPIEYFRTAITPNDAFFVRYHLSNIPEVDVKTWKIVVGGEGANGEAEFTLDDLKRLPAAELVAVNLCSGNRRGLFQPHVPGVEWGYGAMGCARWKGARLKDLLDKAGLKKEAIEIVFDGADSGVTDKTPDFIKSIPTWKAIEDTTLVAYEMNGAPLPHLNGFPARVIVPGWTGVYWMKHITSISAVTRPESGFWMSTAYRIPLGRFPVVARFISQETAGNTPITEMVVNSLITSPADGANVKMGPVVIGGIAWDGGHGIRTVEVSSDGGKTWVTATLGEDLGRFAFRTFSYNFAPKAPGKQTVMARATNKIGQSQTTELIHNPAGYHHNVVHSVTFNVA